MTPRQRPRQKNFLPGPVLLLGAPGVGKGTQAKLLMAAYGIPQISTGDILRANIAKGTDARQSRPRPRWIRAPRLRRPRQSDGRRSARSARHGRGYILDGFPRTLNQATWLDCSDSPPTSPTLPVVAISIVVDYDQLLHRITGRRICPACHIYNIYSNPPKIAGICD